MTDKNEALKEAAKSALIVIADIAQREDLNDYYGVNEGALLVILGVAESEAAKFYHSGPLIKEIGELKIELDEFREAAIIDIKKTHSLEEEIEALKKEKEKLEQELYKIRNEYVEEYNKVIDELTALKSQNNQK